MSRRKSKCYTLEVDGQSVRVQGRPPTTKAGRDAMADIIRAARKHLDLPDPPARIRRTR